MASSNAAARRRHFDAWPGYVDVLSTLLMVIIFTLMVFVMGQFFLGHRANVGIGLVEHGLGIGDAVGDLLVLAKLVDNGLNLAVLIFPNFDDNFEVAEDVTSRVDDLLAVPPRKTAVLEYAEAAQRIPRSCSSPTGSKNEQLPIE